MNAGEMVEGEFDRLANDLELLCREAGQKVTFKVIIESGMLETPEDVYRASMLAILSGADFVKTSTGKSAYGATPKSAMVICNAIKDYYLQTGINVGISWRAVSVPWTMPCSIIPSWKICSAASGLPRRCSVSGRVLR